MGKRMGANARKRMTARTGKTRPGLLRVFLIGIVSLSACGTGAVLYGKYKSRFPDIRNVVENFRNTKVDSVIIVGAVHLRPAEIMRRSGVRLPITLDQLKRRYMDAFQKTSEWIERAEIIRRRGGTVTVGIRERTPMVLLQTTRPGKLVLADAKGVCLPLDQRVSLDLPLVSGLADSSAGDGVRMLTNGDCARMCRFFNEATKFDPSFVRRMTQVHFTKDNAVRIMLSGSATVLLFDEHTVAERLKRFAQIWETVKNDSLPPARIDLSYNNLAFVTLRNETTAAAAAGKKTKG
jgi:cell division septal protein FtsQ